MGSPEVREYIKKGHYAKALTEVEKNESTNELTTTERLEWLYYKALIFNKLGNFEAALRIAQEIIETNETTINPLLTIDAKVIFAEAYWCLDKEKEALTILEEANQVLNDVKDDFDLREMILRRATLYYYEGAVLLNIGKTNYNLSKDVNTHDFDFILEKAEQSLSLFEEIHHSEGIAQAQQILGFCYMHKNQFEKALALLQDSLSYYKKAEQKVAIADTLEVIGIYYFGNHIDYNQALGYFKKSLAIREELNHTYGLARSYYFIGDVYSATYEKELALDYYQKSLTIMEQLHYEHEIRWIYFRLGELFQIRGEFSLASDYLQKSLALFKKAGNQKGIATCYTRLGTIALASSKDFTRAQNYQERSIELLNKLQSRGITYFIAMGNLGWVRRELGQLSEALELWIEALTVTKKLGWQIGVTQALQNIGAVYRLKGKYKQALKHYQQAISIQRNLAGGVYGDLLRAWSCYDIIVLITQYFPEEDALPYVKELEQLVGGGKGWQAQIYPVAKALYLKTSKRVRDHYKAQEILEKVVNEFGSFFDPNIGFIAELTLCELLLVELKASGENEVLQEIKSLIQKMQSTAEQNRFIPLLIEISILHARLRYVEGKFQSAMNLLNAARAIAEEENLHSLVEKVSSETVGLERDLEKWQGLIQRNASIQERLEQSQVEEYLQGAQKLVSSMK